MDIQRATKTSNYKAYALFAFVLCLISVSVYAYVSVFSNDASVNRDSLVLASVERSEFVVSVRGMGVLSPKQERWISSMVDASVDQLFVKPGSLVMQGDPIAQLSNPELNQALEERQWELDELIATNNALKASLDNELLNLEAAVLEAKLNYERSMLTLSAQQKLMKEGVNAVSQIDFESSKIEAEQNKKRHELAQARLASQKLNNKAQLLASQARFNRTEHLLKRAQQRASAMLVVAAQDAVVKELPVELGQRISAGTNIVKIVSRDEFIAEIQIPENLINQVNIGQEVQLDSRASRFTGKVNRIDPAVINGLVQVDIEITDDMPREARPDLSIEGVIEITRKQDTLFVKRPMFARSLDEMNVFVMNQDGSGANNTAVAFGQSSSTHIEVLDGLKAGQTIIISDATKWSSEPYLVIN